MSGLPEIINLDAQRRTAETALKHAIQEAVANGVPIARISKTIGIARTTIYRWIQETDD